MTDPTMQQVLDRLDTLQSEVVALRRQVKRKRTTRRLLPLALVALLVALVPRSSLAAISFNDLNPNSVHNANIQAIADAGITKGCDPGVSYCPNGLVTREEMASFLARTAGLGGNPPVVNALTAQAATNAAQLNGHPASFYQAASQPIASAINAARVGGRSPGDLVRAARASRNTAQPLTRQPQDYLTVTLVAPAPGFIILSGNVGFKSNVSSGGQYAMMYALLLQDQGAATNYAPAVTIPLVLGAWAAAPIEHAFPVQAGTQTFRVRVSLYSESQINTSSACNPAGDFCYIDAVAGTITAIFVPFGDNGGTTLAP